MKLHTFWAATLVLAVGCTAPDASPPESGPSSSSEVGDQGPVSYSDLPATGGSTLDFEMRPRPSDPAEFAEYIDYLLEVAEPRTAEERALDVEVMDRFAGADVVDGLFVGAPGFPAGFTDEQYETAIQHSLDNRYTLLSATVTNASPADPTDVVRERMVRVNEYWAAQPDRYLQVRSFDDIARAKREGRLAIMHNFQGMMPLGANNSTEEALANLREFYDLGLRQMLFTYNIDTRYADGGVSNSDGTDQGITDLGEEVIREMNRLGIVVDCSHSSNQTCIEAAAVTRRPMMMSHSQMMTYQPIDRNVSDEAVRAVAATDGVICVTFIGGFLNPQGTARPYDIAKHVQYIRDMVGPEATCVGPDYVYNYAETLLWILENPENFPIEMGYATPSHMGKPGEIWGVVRELQLQYGWTDNEIRGFLGGNLLRVYRDNFTN